MPATKSTARRATTKSATKAPAKRATTEFKIADTTFTAIPCHGGKFKVRTQRGKALTRERFGSVVAAKAAVRKLVSGEARV